MNNFKWSIKYLKYPIMCVEYIYIYHYILYSILQVKAIYPFNITLIYHNLAVTFSKFMSQLEDIF